jgi:hypothetical protein
MMGWTAPRTWSVGEVVTKAIMDTHVRDNLRYLKGLDGAVTIEDRLTLPVASGTNGRGLRFASGANDFAGLQGFDDGSISYAIMAANRYFDGSAYQQMNARAGANLVLNGAGFLIFNTFATSSNTQVERARIDSSGRLGLGTNSPLGPIHADGALGGGVLWEYDGVDGTSRTVATGLSYVATVLYAVRDSNGTTYGGTVNGMTTTAFPVNDGTNILKLEITGGNLICQRTGGTRTYKVQLWAIYI